MSLSKANMVWNGKSTSHAYWRSRASAIAIRHFCGRNPREPATPSVWCFSRTHDTGSSAIARPHVCCKIPCEPTTSVPYALSYLTISRAASFQHPLQDPDTLALSHTTLTIRPIDQANAKLLVALMKVSEIKSDFEALAKEASTPLTSTFAD